MTDRTPQTFENHVRYVPLFHVGLFGILVVNLAYTVYKVIRVPSYWQGWQIVMATGFLLMFFFMRRFPVTVQDRVIRLEMRLRLKMVLPADLQARIVDLAPGQLIALRFASDAELPELVRWVLAENVSDRKVIKARIKSWQADYLRA